MKTTIKNIEYAIEDIFTKNKDLIIQNFLKALEDEMQLFATKEYIEITSYL